MNNEKNVQTVDIDLDTWLGAPGSESIVTQEAETKKPNVFTKEVQDLSFLNTEESSEEVETNEDGSPKIPDSKKPDSFEDVIKEVQTDETPTEDGESEKKSKTGAGRPKTDKSGLVEFFKKRIESKEMFAFDDYDESKQSLDEYLSSMSEKDLDDLWEANITNLKEDVASKTPQEFFESLPEELQYAAQYVANGGKDLKGLFQALAQSEEVRQLDPTDQMDQESIVRSYLQATNFGTQEEIEEEITGWKDLGSLEKKAKQFKPKLDKLHEEVVQYQLAEQAERNERQKEAANKYTQNVYEVLKPAELNGIKLDKKTQVQLYNGLVDARYSSITGKQTNLLGHLLEKYQFVEPNYSLVAEALWLLSNPDSYRKEIKNQGSTEKVEETVKKLKTEQANRSGQTSNVEINAEKRSTISKLTKPKNIFQR